MGEQERGANAALRRAMRAADAVLAVDMSDVLIRNRVPQTVVGWCRAVFAQIRAIGILIDAGVDSSHGPNQRLVFEAAVRLVWLNSLDVEQRGSAVDEMLGHECKNTKRTIDGARAAGFDADFDLDEMLEFPLDSKGAGRLYEEAKNFAAASTASGSEVIYSLWREASGLAHASGRLAGDYAPVTDRSTIGTGKPAPLDQDHESLADVMLLTVVLTAGLLVDEGISRDHAARFTNAYLRAS